MVTKSFSRRPFNADVTLLFRHLIKQRLVCIRGHAQYEIYGFANHCNCAGSSFFSSRIKDIQHTMHIACHRFKAFIECRYNKRIQMAASIFKLCYAEIRIYVKIQRFKIYNGYRLVERSGWRSEHAVHYMTLRAGKDEIPYYHKIITIK